MHKPKSHYRHMNYELAQRIRELYFKEHLKQTQIAAMHGIRQNTVSRIVSDQVWSR